MRLQLQKFNVAVQAKKQQRHLQATYYACDKKEKKNTRRKWKKYKSDEIEDNKGNNDVNMLYMPWINNKAFFYS
uniref:Uncharacterized protein n=1 Tax=Vitis vinifera TaxID=29760 RepID=F6I2L0_VITVI